MPEPRETSREESPEESNRKIAAKQLLSQLSDFFSKIESQNRVIDRNKAAFPEIQASDITIGDMMEDVLPALEREMGYLDDEEKQSASDLIMEARLYLATNRPKSKELEATIEAPYDVEKEITDDDWKGMKDGLKEFKRRGRWDYFFLQAMRMKILNPKVDLEIDDEALENMAKATKELKEYKYWNPFFSHAMRIKILNPEQDLEIDDDARQAMKNELARLKEQGRWDAFAYQAMNVKIVDPSFALDLNEPALSGMKDEMKKHMEKGLLGGYYYHDGFFHQAAKLKVLDSSQDVGMSKDAWEWMRLGLNDSRRYGHKIHGDWLPFSEHAMEAKILAAKKVEVTEKGLEIKM